MPELAYPSINNLKLELNEAVGTIQDVLRRTRSLLCVIDLKIPVHVQDGEKVTPADPHGNPLVEIHNAITLLRREVTQIARDNEEALERVIGN